MPRYILDTKMCVYLMKNQPKEVAQHFALCYVGDVVMSSITYAELEYGVAVSANPEQEKINLASLVEDILVFPFDSAAGEAYGPIRLASRETKQDALDKLIAAHAVSLNAIVVTNNTKGFARYPGLVIENWIESPNHQGNRTNLIEDRGVVRGRRWKMRHESGEL